MGNDGDAPAMGVDVTHKPRLRDSGAYITIMNVNTTAPKIVDTKGAFHAGATQ